MVQDTSNFVRQLTGLQTYVGLRSEYNFQANTIKTYVSVEIRPRPDKYYLIELVNDPRGARNVTQRTIRSDDPSKPLLTREEQIEVTDAFRFSFQFAADFSGGRWDVRIFRVCGNHGKRGARLWNGRI